MLRIGVIGIPEGWSSRLLVQAFRDRHCEASLIDMENVVVHLDTGLARHDQIDLNSLDAMVIKKVGSEYSPGMLDRLASLSYIGRNGMRIFSDPLRIKLALDRLSCTVMLRKADIPMPPTVVTECIDEAVDAVQRFGRAVLKPLYSTRARGMIAVENGADPRRAVTEFREQGHQTLYIQKLLPLSGRDLGLVFLGGEYIGCYARIAKEGSWNTTIQSGGRYEKYEPQPEIIELSRKAQAPFGLDFTCVDLAETDDGPVVFEVSAFGGFRGLWVAHSFNAAERYADYVLENLSHGQ